MTAWNSNSEVLSPVGAVHRGTARRAASPSITRRFRSDYSDIVDYIIRCTHRIWEQKDIGLCRTHYADDCVVHTMTGPTMGVEAVVQGTINALASYPDRRVIAEDVIWSEDEPGVFLSSHRIVSDATHLGDEASAFASLSQAGVSTIADCLVSRNRIVEEWLVRDNLTAARQIGCDPWALAVQQADADGRGDPARHEWRKCSIEQIRTRKKNEPWPDTDHRHAARRMRGDSHCATTATVRLHLHTQALPKSTGRQVVLDSAVDSGLVACFNYVAHFTTLIGNSTTGLHALYRTTTLP